MQITTLRTTASMFLRTHYKAMLALAGMASAISVYGIMRDTTPAFVARTDGTMPYILLHATATPFSVEGVLVSKEDSFVATQTAGRLASVSAREGVSVARGEVLAVVGQPVLAAQRDALVARIASVKAQRSFVEKTSAGVEAVAQTNVDAGKAMGVATVAVAEATYHASRDTLVVALEGSYLRATEALNFLADTTSVANSDVQLLRAEAVRALAGSARADYLGESPRMGGATRGFADTLATVKVAEVDDVAVLTGLADSLYTGLDTLARAFDTAEREAYQRNAVASNEEVTAYNTYRTSVRTAQAEVRTAQGHYTTAHEALISARVSNTEHVAVQTAELARVHAQTSGEATVSTATLHDLEAQLRALDTSLGEAVVYAPYNGMVTDVLVDAGTYVMPGTPVVRMHSDSGYEVEIVIAPAYLSHVSQGTVGVFAGGIQGVVDRVSPQIAEGTGGASVFVVLDDTSTTFVPGMRVRGELMLASGDDAPVFMVPHSYMAFDFDGPVVRTKDATTLPVKVVRDTKEWMYVTGEGLQEGMGLVR
ncbi:MAG: HlyD family efflux transporter periplasmic adaptor subunit [Candidatus Pacebacteria bacterium]|nr:HlyD family efflux transporter periplasmic adaptor subunit [Candidatus Paceibacterota bacterium]